jgi:acyl-CoA thioesterase FadM
VTPARAWSNDKSLMAPSVLSVSFTDLGRDVVAIKCGGVDDTIAAFGYTVHVAVDPSGKPRRLPSHVRDMLA